MSSAALAHALLGWAAGAYSEDDLRDAVAAHKREVIPEARDHAVTTFYLAHGLVLGRPIVHAYGPYTKAEAQAVRRRLMKDNPVGARAVFNVSVCKLLHADAKTGVVA